MNNSNYSDHHRSVSLNHSGRDEDPLEEAKNVKEVGESLGMCFGSNEDEVLDHIMQIELQGTTPW